MANDPAIDQSDDDDAPLVAPGRLRAEAIRRLQIGITGLFAMILLVSLASVIKERVNQSESTTVPTVTASDDSGAAATPNKDPLADAGVAPELPAASGSPAAQAGNAANRH